VGDRGYVLSRLALNGIVIRGHRFSSHAPGTQGTPGVVIWGPMCVVLWCEGKLD
jgi:hypothetical protein